MSLGYLGIDQYGDKYVLTSKYPRKELLEQFSASHAEKMYVDRKDGSSKHTGYIIQGRWIAIYKVSEWK